MTICGSKFCAEEAARLTRERDEARSELRLTKEELLARVTLLTRERDDARGRVVHLEWAFATSLARVAALEAALCRFYDGLGLPRAALAHGGAPAEEPERGPCQGCDYEHDPSCPEWCVRATAEEPKRCRHCGGHGSVDDPNLGEEVECIECAGTGAAKEKP